MIRRTLRLGRPLSLGLTLRPITHGRNDLCARLDGDEQFLYATRTPQGPVTMRLVTRDADLIARCWGEGADWQLAHLEEFVGEHQSDGDFETDHPVVHDLYRRLVGLRVPRTRAVFASLLPTIIEQRVTGMEAKHAYRRIVRDFGEPAPGPFGLWLPPMPEALAGTPYWVFHRYGIERKRADAIKQAAMYANKLEAAVDMLPDAAIKRLQLIPGIGPWTAGTVATTALGDPDAVIVGDFHIPNIVSWALANEPRGDDTRMLELLEQFRGQRGLVTRLLVAGAGGAPKYGPRYNPLPLAAY